MRLSLVVLLALAACDGSTPPKESSTINNDDTAKTDDTAQTNDTGGTDTDTTPTFLMILVADDVASESILWTSGIFDLTINSDGGSGTITYAEQWDDNTPFCEGVWPVTVSPWSEFCASGDLGGCQWAVSLVATPDASAASCVFPVPDNAPGLIDGIEHFAAWYTDTNDNGTDYLYILRSGYVYSDNSGYGYATVYADDGTQVNGSDQYNVETGDLHYDNGMAGITYPSLYNECGSDIMIESGTSYTDAALGSGTIACSDEMADVWTFDASEGQTLDLTIDSANDDDPEVFLVGPDGCLLGSVDDTVNCSGGNALCPSLSAPLNQTGTWSVIVKPGLFGCERMAMNYSLSGTLH